MKKATLIGALCFTFSMTGIAMARPELVPLQQAATQQAKKRPVVVRRQIRQQKRIVRGVKSGQLTRHETRNLERQQARIQRTKRIDRKMNGGKLTPKNRRQLNRMQNRASRNIYRKKHNQRVQH